MTEPDFAAFAALLREMSPAANEYAPWVDRPDLPARVRSFWSAVGVPPFRAEMLPKASKEADQAILGDVFEGWFEDALTRDRWTVEPEDEPVPWRRLPPHPRVVDTGQRRILVVSDVEPEPVLHTVRQTHPDTVPLAFGHSLWCMRVVLLMATRENAASYWFDRQLDAEPICPGLDIGVSRVSDGIYSIAPVVKDERKWFVPRDIDTFTEFAMTLSPEERGRVEIPYGLKMEVRLPKTVALDPTSKQIDSNFTPIYRQPPEPRTTRLVGRIGGRWVWIESYGPSRHIRVTCDASASPAVSAWLESAGATITSTKELGRPMTSYW